METVNQIFDNESDKTSTKFTGYHAFYRSVAASISFFLLNSKDMSVWSILRTLSEQLQHYKYL